MVLPRAWTAFQNIWVVDFEFFSPEGACPSPICCVAQNVRSGAVVRHWLADEHVAARQNGHGAAGLEPPYTCGPADLLVAYFASAEMGCHLQLHWPLPTWLLDLYSEFRVLTNGRELPGGRGLLGACEYFGLPLADAVEKTGMRALALRGGPWTVEEQQALLTYCQHDVEATAALFARMQPSIDLPRSLLRGRYMTACARMEHVGVPIDVPMLSQLRQSWDTVKAALIARVDEAYGVFEGATFKQDRFERYLTNQAIPWGRTETGQLKLDDQTFRDQSMAYPQLHPLRELRVSLSQLRLRDLAVGPDGRNRTLLSPFGAKTGRNAPSTSKLVFGPSTWLRHLIRPVPDTALCYIDWAQQEFGIAAALSGDPNMRAAYESGDPYISFARQAGAVPPDATKASHGLIREQFKTCVLGVQYAMGSETLARRIGQSPAHAAHLLALHRQTYPRFWQWSESAVSYAMATNQIHSVFGWTLHVGADVNPRTLQNYPMQANGAEMLRLACCLATEAGIHVCVPVHDALLVEAPIAELEPTIVQAQRAMADASQIVLGGFTLRSSATRILFPDRFVDPRGAEMWRTVMAVLQQHERQ